MRSAAQRAAQLKAAKASALARRKRSLPGEARYATPSRGEGRTRRNYWSGTDTNSSKSGVGGTRMSRSNQRKDQQVQNKAVSSSSVPNKMIGDARRYKNANGGTISAAGVGTSRNLAKGGSTGQTERRANQEAIRLKGISMVVGKRDPKMK